MSLRLEAAWRALEDAGVPVINEGFGRRAEIGKALVDLEECTTPGCQCIWIRVSRIMRSPADTRKKVHKILRGAGLV